MAILNKNEKSIIIIWTIIFVSFFVFATTLASLKVKNDKIESKQHHKDRIDAHSQEAGRTWIDPDALAQNQKDPVSKVKVGIYLDHIVDLSTKNTKWTVAFYIWFKWKDKDLHPGKNFQVLNGEILSIEKIDSTSLDNQFYEQYRVVTEITKFFNVTRYPRDNHLLTIAIENKIYQWQQMQYIPDIEVSDISSRVKLPGYAINDSIIMVTKPHPYKTSRGNARFSAEQSVYDQLIYGLEIYRSDWGLYFKMFLSLFASVAIAFLVFFMKPTDDGRVSLGIGAFFASIASSYVSTTELPGVGILTLCDMINILGMVTIFLTVLCSVAVKHLAVDSNKENMAKIFNKVSFVVFVLGYVISNVIIAQVASL